MGAWQSEDRAQRDSRHARAKTVDPRFSLALHLARVLGIASAIGAFGLWLAADASAIWWLAVPGFWLVANVFEWAMHRFLMHRPLRPRMLYQSHALVHHNAFDGDDQEIRDVTELSVVMMPWYTLILVFVMASPITLAIGLMGGWSLAGMFLVAAVVYFLVYETIHTLHHLPATTLARSRLGRSRVLTRLRAHHHHHHHMRNMARVNFNVTFPLADRLLGTYERG